MWCLKLFISLKLLINYTLINSMRSDEYEKIKKYEIIFLDFKREMHEYNALGKSSHNALY